MQPGMAVERDPRRWWVLAVMCFALFMGMLDNTVVNVAMPTIQTELGAGLSQMQWIIDAYTLMFASFMLTGGTVADLYGRKKTFLGGLILFATGSLVAALSPSTTVLIAGRALSGLGAALLIPTTLAILSVSFLSDERPKAIGIWALGSGLALALGPPLGGVMVQHLGWQSVFWLNVPVGALGVLVALAVVRESRDTSGTRRLDPIGLALGTSGLAALVYTLIEANRRGPDDRGILAALLASGAMLAAFLLWERHTPSPVLNLRFFKVPAFSGANAVAFIVSFAVFGIFLYISIYLQRVQGYSPSATGLRFVPMMALTLVVAPLAGRIAGRVGSRWPMGIGMFLVGTGMLLLSDLAPSTTDAHLIWPTLLVGGGMSLTMAPMTAAVMGSVDPRMAGIASATTNTTREIGGTFGVAALGTFISHMARSNFPSRLPDTLPAALRDQVIASYAPLTGLAEAPTAAGVPTEVLAQLRQAGLASLTYGIGRAMLLSAALAYAASVISLVFVSPAPRGERPASRPAAE